ncbi:MAG: hypothetical protein V9E98_04675 [Candidatus Nanopelagicales bacterium]
MGLYWPGLPPYVQEWARSTLGSHAAFIETGTYTGATAASVSRDFASVQTIELDAKLASSARKFLADTQVVCHTGDSREILPSILPPVSEPLFVWLDAHYSGGETAGADDPCPLLGELATLMEFRGADNTIIAIDDARCFQGVDGYPTLDEISALLHAHGWNWILVDDILVATSPALVQSFKSTRGQWRMLEAGALFPIWTGVLLAGRGRQKVYGLKRRLIGRFGSAN